MGRLEEPRMIGTSLGESKKVEIVFPPLLLTAIRESEAVLCGKNTCRAGKNTKREGKRELSWVPDGGGVVNESDVDTRQGVSHALVRDSWRTVVGCSEDNARRDLEA